MPEFTVAALYRFAPLADPASLQRRLKRRCNELGLGGTLIVAPEGINGTVAGTAHNIDALLTELRALPGMAELDCKRSVCDQAPFLRLKVRLKPEIVTMGDPDIDPRTQAGTYVDAPAWNELVDDPNVVVLDTRNDYEVRVGTFDRAIDPGLKHFREFPAFAEQALRGFEDRPIAMFCTGGIRCEKASSLLRRRGFHRVYHLEGGILRYFATTTKAASKWRGECFVFDRRVTLKPSLEPGDHSLCYGCLEPVSREEAQSPLHEDGVCCVHCHDRTPAAVRAGRRERARQVRLARHRGELHIGR
ncbi:MAG: rhodanese-related sulfurtransferase [Myxococcales bacterium FL481]|nr:MAG: rhodanese-related sulfurtransferase [Myxococcales bacterium FL481]